MAILKIKDSAGVVTEIASIKGTSGKSPIIQNGYWWNYNDTTKEYENTNISLGNIVTVSDVEPDTDLWVDTSVTDITPIEITIRTDGVPELETNDADTRWLVGRRCLVKKTENGVSISYLNGDNSTLFSDGTTTASLDGTMGQWMVDLPAFYYKVEGDKILISSIMLDNYRYSERVLVGVTKGIITDSKLWSKSGFAPSTDNIVNFHNAANNVGDGFDIIEYETRKKLLLMYYAKFATRNVVEGFGTANAVSGSTATLGNNNGTTSTQTNIFGIEDLYGNIGELTAGLISLDTRAFIFNGYWIDREPIGDYRSLYFPFEVTTSGFISKVSWNTYGDFLPLAFSGSSSTYYCDYAEVVKTGWSVAIMGGNSSANAGLTYLSLVNPSTDANAGSRLQYKGEITVIDNPATFKALAVGF